MNRRRRLYEDPSVGVTLYDHPAAPPHRDPREELSSVHALCFLERGGFEVLRGRRSWRLGAGSLFVTWPGMTYRCAHDAQAPDDVCLSVRLSPDLIEQAECAAGSAWRRHAPVAELTNRLSYLKGRLLRALESDEAALAVPALGGEMAAALAAQEHEARRRLYRPAQLAWHAERVEAACSLMQARYAEDHSLAELSRHVGVSPFHFSRVFRELVGMPPHRYLVGVRLRQAAARLREGASVTRAAREAGFHNLSHFVRRFHRVYGALPSRYGRGSRSEKEQESASPPGGRPASLDPSGPRPRKEMPCSIT